jgi:hypothetical protein
MIKLIAMKSKLIILIFAVVSVFLIFNREEYKSNVFQYDVSGYYLYLPAIFIYHDLGNFNFYPALNQKYNLTGDADHYALFPQPTGRRTNKYAIGTAVFELPFFLIAHTYCKLSGAYEADGYTYPYQFAGIFCCIFWVCMGLLFIRNLLIKNYTDSITGFVVLCIAFGTSIYCYTHFLPGMSHPYGFFLFSAILYCTDALYREQKSRYFYWLGILLGFVIITRPVNIVVAVIPLLWQVFDMQSLKARGRFFSANMKRLLLSGVLFLLVAMIQMSYWKYTTAHWIHYSYEGESFNFLHPHIIQGLFGYQKGWFIYTPVAFVSILALFYLWIKERKTAPSLLLFFALIIYVVFSWREWWYGGGFSARALVESLPVLALPLAFLSHNIFHASRSLSKKITFSAIMVLFVALNLFQSYQFSLGTINSGLMNRAYYWAIFGKVHPGPNDSKLMMSEAELEAQRVDCFRVDK